MILFKKSQIVKFGTVLIVVVTILLWLFFRSPGIFAAWYDLSWSYRQSVTLTNNGSTKSNYQVQVVVPTGNLISAGKMRSDCNDVRFTQSDGTTTLSYWNEYCFSSSGKYSSFWVTVPSLASGSSTIYIYYGNGSATSVSSYSSLPSGINVGTGNDGSITVAADKNINSDNQISGRSCSDGGDGVNYSVTENRSSGTNQIVLSTTPSSGCLSVGDEILVINLQGTTVNHSNVGKFETARISSISSATLTLNHNLANGYDGTTQKIMVQRIPNYSSVTVNSAIKFTVTAWNGTKGGVMIFRTSGTVTVTGTIHTNGSGFAGGAGGAATALNGGVNGESYDGSGSSNVGRGGNGGTGGETKGGGRDGKGATTSPNNGITRGGGGGGGAAAGNDGVSRSGAGAGGGYGGGGGGGGGATSGNGTTAGTGGTGGVTGTAAGGGGGGCGDTGARGPGGNGGNAGSAGGASTGCSNNGAGGQVGVGATSGSGGGGGNDSVKGSGAGGGGGGTYGSSSLTTLYFGSGGGGGGVMAYLTSYFAGGTGGKSGGIVYIGATTVSVSGSISSQGNGGGSGSYEAGKGGGGAGGSIYVTASTATLGSSLVVGVGGTGGSQSARIPGGGSGGVGRIAADYSSSSGTANPSATTSTIPVASAPATEESAPTPTPSPTPTPASTPTPIPSPTPIPADLSGYWKTDEGSGITSYDSSYNRGNGTVVGSPSWQTSSSCISGTCLSYNGSNQYINISDSTYLQPAVLSVSAWVKPTSIGSTYAIVSKQYGTSTNLSFSLRLNNGLMEFKVCNSSATCVTTTDTGGALTANAWYHIMGTYDGSNAVVYRNGKEANSTSGSITIAYDTNPIFIAARSSDATTSTPDTDYFPGLIDEVKIYKTAHSASQVKAEYNNRGGINGQGIRVGSVGTAITAPVGYWKFDQGYGSSVTNSGTQGSTLNGTLVSASWINGGKYGRALSFNGVTPSRVDMGNPSALQFTGDFTLSSWIYANAIDGSSHGIVSKFNNVSGQRGYRFGIQSGTGKPTIEMSDDGTTTYTATTNTSVTAQTWTHLIVVYRASSGAVDFYINGMLDRTVTGMNTSVYNTAKNFQIGTWDTDTISNSFAGYIDEVKTYTYALSASQVKVDYNRSSSLLAGVLGTLTSDGKTPSSSQTTAYCVPGDTTACDPPVAEWNFEEGLGTLFYDTSGNGHSGPTTNNPIWIPSKRTGKGIYFNGSNQYTRTSDSSSIYNLPSSSTMEAWGYTASGNSSGYGIIVHKRGGADGWGFRIDNWAGPEYCSSVEAACNGLNWAERPQDNVWAHYTWVIDRSAGKYYGYINGALTDQNSISVSVNTSEYLCFGGRCVVPDQYYKGGLDQVRIFDYARTPAQIQWDYNQGKSAGWWKFDECTGSTAHDSSGNLLYNSNVTAGTPMDGTITIGASGSQTGTGACTTVNTATAWYNGVTGKDNYSLNLDGTDDYLTTSAYSELIANRNNWWTQAYTVKNFSWGGWFYPTSSIASKTLMEKASEFRLTTDANGKPTCGVYYSSAFHDATSGSKALALSTWNHVLCVYNGSTIKTYINGIEVGSTSETTGITPTRSTFYIGQNSSGSERYSGKLDDVKVWAYNLTFYQIKLEFNNLGNTLYLGPQTGAP